MINKFIGSGIIFPLVINSEGRVDIVNDNSLIEASIKNILYWPKETRCFNRKYGCRIEEILEEPDDSIGISLVRLFIFEALDKNEKRIILKDVETIDSTSTKVNIRLTYIMRNTRLEETMIFPFYKEINF